QRLLGLLAGGDVLGDPADPVDLPGLVAEGKAPVPDPADRAVRPHDPVLFVGVLAQAMPAGGFAGALPVLGVDGLQVGLRAVIEALARAAPDLLVAGADEEHLRVAGVGHPEDPGDVLRQLAEAALRLAQRRLRALALGDVPADGRGAGDGARSVLDGRKA